MDYIGARVQVIFEDGLRYPGTVGEYARKTSLHRIDYDDGVVEWSSIPDDGVEVVSMPRGRAPGSHANPAKRKRRDDHDGDVGDAAADAGDFDYVGERVYGNFDIIFGPFLAHLSAPLHPTRAVCYALPGTYADWLLIGAWNPML